jgi:hypothetical protein
MDFTLWTGEGKVVGGNQWLLLVTDHFSKYAWGIALPTKEADGVTQFILSIINVVGATPKILHSDNGGEFVSDCTSTFNQFPFLLLFPI